MTLKSSNPGLRHALRITALALFAAIAPAYPAHAQQTTQVHDASALKPPAGARVAIIEFEDMECPVCGLRNPVLKKASEDYKIPLIRHDFPLQQHVWSFQAAVNARWFDAKSKKLGDEYRDAIFAGQNSIYNLNALNDFSQKFASSHGLAFPMAVDPMGKLTADVKADYALGQRIGIDHTPTVWIVASPTKGAPFMEVQTSMSNLYTTIDQALRDTKDAAGPASAAAKKKPAGK